MSRPQALAEALWAASETLALDLPVETTDALAHYAAAGTKPEGQTCTCKPYYECPECEPEHFDFTPDSLLAAVDLHTYYDPDANVFVLGPCIAHKMSPDEFAAAIIQAAKEATDGR